MNDVIDDLRGIAALDESRGETRLGIGLVCTRAVDEIKKLRVLREEGGWSRHVGADRGVSEDSGSLHRRSCKMNDIVTILRDISNESDIDADIAEACRDGAREIDTVRGELSAARLQCAAGHLDRPCLTAAERSAIADAADRYAELTPESRETAATLRGILDRL